MDKHPLVSQMLKGGFNEKPLRPKHESIWNVDQVLIMFSCDGPSIYLLLQCLTIKMGMLLALTCPCRGADLATLDLNNRLYVPEAMVFQPSHLSKQSRLSQINVAFFFPYFKEDIFVCLFETLKGEDIVFS